MDSSYLSIPTHAETERLILRSYQSGDGLWYYEMSQLNRSHLMAYESGNAVMRINSVEDAEQIIREYEHAWEKRIAFFLAAFRKDTQEFVAQLYIGAVNWELPEFELGYFSDRKQEGQGYVTEAAREALRLIFEHLGAHRVSLECDDTNLRSARVAERCGFVREGHIRENKKHPDDSLSGTLHYGILRREFQKNIP